MLWSTQNKESHTKVELQAGTILDGGWWAHVLHTTCNAVCIKVLPLGQIVRTLNLILNQMFDTHAHCFKFCLEAACCKFFLCCLSLSCLTTLCARRNHSVYMVWGCKLQAHRLGMLEHICVFHVIVACQFAILALMRPYFLRMGPALILDIDLIGDNLAISSKCISIRFRCDRAQKAMLQGWPYIMRLTINWQKYSWSHTHKVVQSPLLTANELCVWVHHTGML